MAQKLFLPTKDFRQVVLYREPMESDVWVIFPEHENASYRADLEVVRRWMLLMWKGEWHFVDLALDQLWNLYHVGLRIGSTRTDVRPLSAAKKYFAAHEGLETVIDATHRRPLF